jgi:hypothetical protein
MSMNGVIDSTSKTFATISTISGQTIAKSKWNVQARALLAAKWRLDQVSIKPPTTKMAADVFRVSVQPVNAAIAEIGTDANEQDLRRHLLEGPPESGPLTEHLLRATEEEWLEAARAIGPAVIWDRHRLSAATVREKLAESVKEMLPSFVGRALAVANASVH